MIFMSSLCSVRLLTIAQLAEVLGLSTATINNRLVNQPHTLPPRRVIPDCSSVRFSSTDVAAWIQKLQTLEGTSSKTKIRLSVPTDAGLTNTKQTRPTAIELENILLQKKCINCLSEDESIIDGNLCNGNPGRAA
jgi:predicted DNA-binding transcriptional regulator AlpA